MTSFRAVNPHTAEEFGPEIQNASQSEVAAAIEAANAPLLAPAQRAQLLRNISLAIESDRAKIVPLAMQESGLPEARINGELTREWCLQLCHSCDSVVGNKRKSNDWCMGSDDGSF